MKYEECLKIRWKATGVGRWALIVGGEEVAIVQAVDGHYDWAAGGRFDWTPGRVGAMRNARWAYYINQGARYGAQLIFANNSSGQRGKR